MRVNEPFVTKLDEYRFRKVLGEGGSGVVIEVVSGSGKTYALKRLHESSASERVKRFRNEIQFCVDADHPNIVKIIDYGMAGKGTIPFYVMPVYGATLRKFFTRGDVLLRQRLEVFARVIEGVIAAHERGVAHRDLKPENVLMSDDAREVVIADFGIAAFIEAKMDTEVNTGRSARLANFKYCAPEQLLRGGKGDKRSDVFALGMMLNEAATGQIPRGESYVKMEKVHSQLAYLDHVVESMMSQDPDDRPYSLESIRAAINLVLGRLHTYGHEEGRSSRNVADEARRDPLIRSPPKLEMLGWSEGAAQFSLSTAITEDWRIVFAGLGDVPTPPLPDEESPRFARWTSDSTFLIQVTQARAEDLLRAYKLHVVLVNVAYKRVTKRAIVDGAYPWD
jgi:serine/threonine protein kinase